ncbi:aldo/keto reductase [Eubacterium sp.]
MKKCNIQDVEDMWPGPYGNWGSKKYLVASLDQSLKRMGLDYVDIYYHHRPDPQTPLEETARALDGIVKSGKALYVGISNYDKEQTIAIADIFKKLGTPFIINQRKYSIFERKIEEDGLKNYAKDNGIGIITFCPLAQGLLTDRYLNGIPDDSRIRTDGRFLKENAVNEEVETKVRKLNEIAKKRGQTLAQMSLAWILRDDDITSVLIGASKPSQILDNVECINNTEFSEEERKFIDEISLEK